MGDYLYSRAIIELVRLDDLEPLRVFARVTNAMRIGEMRQLEARDKLAYGEEEYAELIGAKTASLWSGACEVGALRAPNAYREALARFGLRLGMAFQIADDLLDYTAPEAVTGKPSGDRKSTRLNSSHLVISYAVFCLKKKKKNMLTNRS